MKMIVPLFKFLFLLVEACQSPPTTDTGTQRVKVYTSIKNRVSQPVKGGIPPSSPLTCNSGFLTSNKTRYELLVRLYTDLVNLPRMKPLATIKIAIAPTHTH